MDDYESLSRTKCDCKYHVVFIPKYRRKVLYGELRQYLGEVFRKLALQKESRIEQGHLMPDHVHMMISIPPEICGFAGGSSDPSICSEYIEYRWHL
jgi:putative transposase